MTTCCIQWWRDTVKNMLPCLARCLAGGSIMLICCFGGAIKYGTMLPCLVGRLVGVIQYGLRTNIASEPSSSDNLSYQCKRWRHELHTSMQYSTTIIPGTPVCKKGKQSEEVVTMEVFLHACSRRVACITYVPAMLWLILAAHLNEPSSRRWKRACQQLFAAHC